MIFTSDNWAGASDKIVAALTASASRPAPAYGSDDATKRVEQQFCELFEKDVSVYMVATGTAANALSIANFAVPGGLVFCHPNAHVATEEGGAVSFFSGGLITVTVAGEGGKLSPAEFDTVLDPYRDDGAHNGVPNVLSLSQLTEWGQAYDPEEVAALTGIARQAGMVVHVDGARFAGAAAATGATPADLTWRAGVDVMSFGGTKNGCLGAEAVVFFDPEHARNFRYARLRAGHGLSKNWFAALQFEAYLDDGHWLELSGAANRAGQRLAAIIQSSAGADLALAPHANEIFANLDGEAVERLTEAGVQFHHWRAGPPATDGRIMARFVTSFQTSEAELDLFAAALDKK
jgi:threonine aldolase